MTTETVVTQSFGSLAQALAASTGSLIAKDAPWLIPAMVVIFGGVQFLKILIAAIQRKKKHGLPKIAVISGVLAVGVLYAWGSGVNHHRPCSIEMVIEGLGLGATNIALFHVWQLIKWIFNLWIHRKEKK